MNTNTYCIYIYRCIHTLICAYFPTQLQTSRRDLYKGCLFLCLKTMPQGAEKRGMVRCPRHNKTFDLATGESPGNCEILQTSLGILKTWDFYVRKSTKRWVGIIVRKPILQYILYEKGIVTNGDFCSRIGVTTAQTMNCLICHRFGSTSSGLYSPTVKRVKIEVWGISEQKSH